MPAKPRRTDTITFSLPPEMAEQVREVVHKEYRWQRPDHPGGGLV